MGKDLGYRVLFSNLSTYNKKEEARSPSSLCCAGLGDLDPLHGFLFSFINNQLFHCDTERLGQPLKYYGARHKIILLNSLNGNCGDMSLLCQLLYRFAPTFPPVAQDHFQVFLIWHCSHLPLSKLSQWCIYNTTTYLHNNTDYYVLLDSHFTLANLLLRCYNDFRIYVFKRQTIKKAGMHQQRLVSSRSVAYTARNLATLLRCLLPMSSMPYGKTLCKSWVTGIWTGWLGGITS